VTLGKKYWNATRVGVLFSSLAGIAFFAVVLFDQTRPPPEPPPPLTQAQDDWIRDVCVPAGMRGRNPSSAVLLCRQHARRVVK
jgi:hypothetical protein